MSSKQNNAPTVTVWGTGMPRREFLYSDDMADACVFLMNLSDDQYVPLLGQDRHDGMPPMVNVGVGEDVTIGELAGLVREVVGFRGDIVFDSSKPDGTPRKLLGVRRLNVLGWKAGIGLAHGLERSYRAFRESAARAKS